MKEIKENCLKMKGGVVEKMGSEKCLTCFNALR
jgi:hypothetical protein